MPTFRDYRECSLGHGAGGPRGSTGVTISDDGVNQPSPARKPDGDIKEQLNAMRSELDSKVSNERADLECLRVHARLDGLEAQLGAMREELAALVALVQL